MQCLEITIYFSYFLKPICNVLKLTLQQMLNLDKDQTDLKVLAAGTYDTLIRTNSDDAIDHLNL